MLTTTQLAQKIDERCYCQRDREMLKRRLIDGATFQELAEETGMSDNGVKGRYKRVLAHFVRAIGEDGLTIDDIVNKHSGA